MTDISLLLIDYKKAAGAYGKANENFDNIAANTEHEKLMRLYSQLKKIGDHSFKELRVYLKDKELTMKIYYIRFATFLIH